MAKKIRKIWLRSCGEMLLQLKHFSESPLVKELITSQSQLAMQGAVVQLQQLKEPIYIVDSTLNCPEFHHNDFMLHSHLKQLVKADFDVYIDRNKASW